jgi:cytochrome c peroxidase
VAAELEGTAHTPESAFTTDEVAGLKVFIGKGNCVNCHNGALLTDNHFHNTGVPSTTVDSGRAVGVRQAIAGEFSCTSKYSDAKAEDCEELRFATTDGEELVRAFKTPSLRNVAARAPYMDAGQLATLDAVIEHYNAAPKAPFGHSELKPLKLSRDEKRQLVAFLQTLSAKPRIPNY